MMLGPSLPEFSLPSTTPTGAQPGAQPGALGSHLAHPSPSVIGVKEESVLKRWQLRSPIQFCESKQTTRMARDYKPDSSKRNKHNHTVTSCFQ